MRSDAGAGRVDESIILIVPRIVLSNDLNGVLAGAKVVQRYHRQIGERRAVSESDFRAPGAVIELPFERCPAPALGRVGAPIEGAARTYREGGAGRRSPAAWRAGNGDAIWVESSDVASAETRANSGRARQRLESLDEQRRSDVRDSDTVEREIGRA